MSTLGKFWKIILSYKWGLLIQFVIFIGLSVAFMVFLSPDPESASDFDHLTDVSIAIFDRDQTPLTAHFMTFMSHVHDVRLDIEDHDEEWLEVATWNVTALILEIPSGFTESFLNGDSHVQLEYLTNQNNAEGFLVRGQIERYFNILSTYLAGGFEIEVASELTAEIFAHGVEVEIVAAQNEEFVDAYFYFRFLPISLIIVVAIATGGVFLALNKQDVTRRIESAPVSYKRRVMERVGACLTFGVLAWGIFVAVSFVLFDRQMIEIDNLIRMVNSLPLVFLGIAIAFMMTQFIEKREMLMPVVLTTVMTLAMPAGIMFDLAMMGEQVLAVARFTPLYWYARVNDMMMFEVTMDWTLVWQSIAIQFAFAAAILAVGMVFSKEKRAKRA